MIFVKASPGRRVKDPITMRLLAEAGELKPATSYWVRRLADGDVVIVEAQAAKPKQEPKLKPAKSLSDKQE